VRHEGDGPIERLLHFSGVPVAEDPVCRRAAVVLGEMRALGRALARAGHAGLRVDDHVAREQPRVHDRLQREERRRGVASRARHQPGAGKGRAAAFGKGVDGAVRQLGGLGIPAPAERLVAQAERAGQVDHPQPAPGEHGAHAGSGRFRQSEEHHLARARERLDVEGLHLAVPYAGQRRQPSRFTTGRHGGRQADTGVPCQQAHQFLAGVTGGPGDGDTHTRRHRCDCIHGPE